MVSTCKYKIIFIEQISVNTEQINVRNKSNSDKTPGQRYRTHLSAESV